MDINYLVISGYFSPYKQNNFYLCPLNSGFGHAV